MYFRDARDMLGWLPMHEKQTNNQGIWRAALKALQGRFQGKQTLIYLDSLLVVDGALGKALKWKRHGWVGSKGPVGHMDPWEEILSILGGVLSAVRVQCNYLGVWPQ